MKTTHECIVCIVNTGFADTVMDAAKKFGARGGTILHARGTANRAAEEFFHITIQPEKELVLILVPTAIKNDILHALYQAVGLDTPGQGIAFSAPVDTVVGITPVEPTPTTEEAGKTAEKTTVEKTSETGKSAKEKKDE